MGMRAGRKIKRHITRKNVNTVNTTVCVPLPLKKKMLKFEKRHAVSWSAVAAKAWRIYMEKHDGKEEWQRD